MLDFDQGATFVVPGPPEGRPGLARLERIAGAGKDMGQFDPEFRLLWVQNTKVQFRADGLAVGVFGLEHCAVEAGGQFDAELGFSIGIGLVSLFADQIAGWPLAVIGGVGFLEWGYWPWVFHAGLARCTPHGSGARRDGFAEDIGARDFVWFEDLQELDLAC